VELPRNVPIDASTVNGGLEVDGRQRPGCRPRRWNGRITVSTSTGPVPGDDDQTAAIEANMQTLTSGDVRLTTVERLGSAGLADAQSTPTSMPKTVNGRVETDFPVKIVGKISPRHLRGTIGTGGATLKLITVNGSITLHEADPNPNPQSARRT